MGCVLAKEVSPPRNRASLDRPRRRREKEQPAGPAPVASGRKSQAPVPKVDTAVDVPDVAVGQEVELPAEQRKPRRSRTRPDPRLRNPPGHVHGEQVAAGWPAWLSRAAGEAIKGWTPRRADTFEKINKIGQGTYSNVYKAKDILTGKIVALKKVRFDNMEPESVKFMAREILILRHLDHPNVVKLEGLVTSRMSCSLYLVFEYMEHDLAGLAASPTIKFTEAQVKCYMHQLLSGLEHCHNNGVLHRDIKGSNLLLDNEGLLKIADFGLATFFDPNRKHPMTSRVVTLWYRPPELLLGATDYNVGVDLWSAGCILAELLAEKPIMPGRTEVEQLHKIFKLCGSPSEEYWKKSKLPHATIFKPQQPYKRCIRETFKAFPPSSFPLIETLLAIDPADRQTATAALNSEFFNTAPYACDPSSLPKYPPSKEMDAKLRDEESRRLRAAGGKVNANGSKKTRTRDRASKAVPAPEANAELQGNIDRRRLITHANAKSKSEKFPPPHQDGALGYPLDSSHLDPSFDHSDASFSTVFPYQKGPTTAWSGPLIDPAVVGHPKRKKQIAASARHPAQLKQLAGAYLTKEAQKDTGSARFR
ncbi:putative serine/threonine-protein kinase [Canna indica]|uniref:[RNA-polymerase]-subunit kinase n=1 Tax=Canna indica TaxID=4628 RepID=A0AAQ3KZQ8_9LILI|nr:putative serine/threonine-protein kinase [Canna indica]